VKGHSRRQALAQVLGGITGLAFLAACNRLPTRAQQPPKVPRMGLLSPGSPPLTFTHQAFLQALRDLGYVEGQTVAIEYRWADERQERLPELAAELVSLDVDLILAAGAVAALAAKGATSTIPIVFAASNDPVGAGLVAGLARPGGNVTGLSLTATALSAKRLEFLKEAVPNAIRIAVLVDLGNPAVERDWDETQVAARALGLHLQRHEVRSPADFEGAFSGMTGGRAQALNSLPSAFFTRNRERLVDLAAQHRLPGMYEGRQYVEAGGLMSYGPDLTDLYRRAAALVDKILKGARPADLPVEQPTKFDLVINLKAARAIGLAIPPSVLQQAT
jgi:putative tryptophan/tyrosine transport system substrate-binding protein